MLREQRKCNWCENELGDEFHFIMNCSNFKTFRNQLIKRHHTIRLSAFTFNNLMNSQNILELKKRMYIYQYCSKIHQCMYIITRYNIVIKPTWLYFYMSGK